MGMYVYWYYGYIGIMGISVLWVMGYGLWVLLIIGISDLYVP